ncbi:MAG: hypothetical protein IPK64_03075 [bacterium]|nr:hypothetical protein [bacterium]
MRNEEKLHVVTAGDVLEFGGRDAKPATAPVTPLTARPPYTTTRRAAVASQPMPAPSRMHYALLLALTWACGPAALLLTVEGRRHRGWLALGILATLALVLLALVPYARWVAWTGLATPLAWSSLALLATIGGFSAWSRAALLAGGHLPPVHRLPRLLRSRVGVGALGLLAPGCGLLAGGSRWHAVLWLWALWPAALGVLVLRAGAGMWQHLSATIPDRGATDLLEHVLMLATACVVLGAIAWLVQALEGARRVAPVPALGRGRGDWFAVALGLSCLGLAVGGSPGRAARQLGDAAAILQADGLSVIPLRLAQAADRLDPARAEYAVLAIALHEQRGDANRAAALRERLDQGLASYVALRERPAGDDGGRRGAEFQPSAVDPAQPAADVLYGTMSRRGTAPRR